MNDKLAAFSFGGIQSEPDYRDIPMSAVVGEAKTFPQSYRVNDQGLPIWNQKKIGACVGHAVGKKKQVQELALPPQGAGKIVKLNPRFPYALAKSIDGIPGEGTFYRLGVKMLQKYGIPEERPEYSNDTDLSHAEYIDLSKISPEVYQAALPYRIASYAQVGAPFAISAEELMQGIFSSDGILLGMQIGKEWWTDVKGVPSWNALDVLPLRPPKSVVSGHAIFADEYEIIGDSRLRIGFTNSWSELWADQGRGWFWYDEIKNFLIEGWAAIDMPNDFLEIVKDLPSAESFHHNFATDIEIGQNNAEVANLQTALMIDGEFDRELYIKLLQQDELGFYGDITRKAARAFQFKHKVAPASELNAVNGRRIGPKTRSKLNELFNH